MLSDTLAGELCGGAVQVTVVSVTVVATTCTVPKIQRCKEQSDRKRTMLGGQRSVLLGPRRDVAVENQ